MEKMICRRAKSLVQSERLNEKEKMVVVIMKMVKKMMMNCHV